MSGLLLEDGLRLPLAELQQRMPVLAAFESGPVNGPPLSYFIALIVCVKNAFRQRLLTCRGRH